jgi:hypothetical protein
MIKQFFVIALGLLSVLVMFYIPIIGLYLVCFSVTLIVEVFLKFKRPLKNLVLISAFCIIWLLLISTTFKWQGNKVIGEILKYHNENYSAPKNISLNNNLKFNSFTPIFTKYNYDNGYDSLRCFLFKLSYTDIWGNTFDYCGKEGEFELRKK